MNTTPNFLTAQSPALNFDENRYYGVDDLCVLDGVIYVALVPVAPGPFDPVQWSAVAMKTDIPFDDAPSDNHQYSREDAQWQRIPFFYFGARNQDPTSMPSGDPLVPGSMYYNLLNHTMFLWDGVQWITLAPTQAGTVSLFYQATIGQTVFDLNVLDLLGNSFALDPSELETVEVHLNGVLLTPSNATFAGDYTVDYLASRIIVQQAVTTASVLAVDISPPSANFVFAVEHDETMTGDGTAIPLSVVPASDVSPGILSVDTGSMLNLTQIPTVPPAQAENWQLGVDVATLADVIAGVNNVNAVTPFTLVQGIIASIPALDQRYVETAGDTMTGGLTVNSDVFIQGHAANPTLPSNLEHLCNKEYVDGRISGLLTLIGVFDASTGQVTYSTASGIPNGPLPPADATNVNYYVIVGVGGTPPIGPPETQIIQNVGDWWVSDGTAWLYLPFGSQDILANQVFLIPNVYGAGDVQTALENSEAITDDHETRITQNEGDILDLQGRVTQNESDIGDLQNDVAGLEASKVDRAGDIMQGLLTLAQDPVNPFDAATMRYVDAQTFDPTDLQDQIDGKVALAGDTMQGPLLLSRQPFVNNEAATKLYVDLAATGARLIIGIINGTNGLCQFSAASGVPAGLLPAASTVPSGSDVICTIAGTLPPDPGLPIEVWNLALQVSDVLISNGTTWFLVHIPSVANITASQVAVIPTVFGAANVQTALQQAAVQDMPPGGTVGQVLGKTGAADYASQWIDPPPTGIQDDSIYMKQIGNVQADNVRNPSMGFSQGLGAPGVSPGQWLYITYNGSNTNNTYILQECFNFGPQPGRVVQSRWVRALIGTGPSWTAWQEVAMGGAGAFVAKTGDTMSGRLQIAVSGVTETTLQPLEIVGGGMQITSQTGGSFRYVNRGNNQGGLTFVTGGVPQYTDWLIFNFNNNALSINNPNGNGITIINGTLTVTSDLSANAGSFSGPVTAATPPTQNQHLCNKGYVDQLFSAAPILIGVIDAGTGNCQFADGTVGPVPVPNGSRHYIICTNPGTVPGLGFVMRLGDQLYDGLPGGVPGWILIAVGTGGIATTADQVALIPNVAGTNNVQAGMQVLNTNKVEKAGDTLTGTLRWPTTVASNPPNATGTSTGERLRIYDAAGAPGMGIGVEPNNMWFNNAAAGNGYRFYLGANLTYTMNSTSFLLKQTGVGGISLHNGSAAQCGYTEFFTQENTRRGYIGYKGGGNTLIMKAENGWTWEITETLPYLNLTGALLTTMAPNTEGIRLRKNNTTANTTTPRLKFEASDGRAMGWIFGMQLGGNGYYGTWPSQIRCTVGLGGFGEQTCWTSVAYGGGWVGLRVEGDLSARSYFNNSDASLKTNIAPLDISHAAKLFDSIIPKQFHWKPVKIRTKLGGEMPGVDEDPTSINWGFIANDIEKVAPKLVQKNDEGKSSYDLTAMVAILWAKVKELEERLAAKEHG